MKNFKHLITVAVVGMIGLSLTSCQKDEPTAPARIQGTATPLIGKALTNAQIIDRENFAANSKITEYSGHALTAEGVGQARSLGALTGIWKLTSVAGAPVDLHTAEVPWVALDNTLRGFGGCNQLFGTMVLQGDHIFFVNLSATKQFCTATHDLEVQFIAALKATDSYYQFADRLTLFASDQEVATLQWSAYHPAQFDAGSN